MHHLVVYLIVILITIPLIVADDTFDANYDTPPDDEDASAITHGVVSMGQLQFLKNFGYLSETFNISSVPMVGTIDDNAFTIPRYKTVPEVELALGNFQTLFNIPSSGQMDEMTISQMNVPRCGNTDNIASQSTSQQNIPKFNHTNLTWNFHMAGLYQLEAARDAFEMWSNLTPTLTFTYMQGMDVDILITMELEWHYTRDRKICESTLRQNVLGHAIFTYSAYDTAQIHINHNLKYNLHYPDRTDDGYFFVSNIGT